MSFHLGRWSFFSSFALIYFFFLHHDLMEGLRKAKHIKAPWEKCVWLDGGEMREKFYNPRNSNCFRKIHAERGEGGGKKMSKQQQQPLVEWFMLPALQCRTTKLCLQTISSSWSELPNSRFFPSSQFFPAQQVRKKFRIVVGCSTDQGFYGHFSASAVCIRTRTNGASGASRIVEPRSL